MATLYNWQPATIGDLASAQRNALVGGPFGSNLVSRDYVEDGIPVIRGQNMGGRWVGGKFAFVSLAKATSLDANIARPGDIVFTQRGTLGQVSLVPDEPYDRYVVSQSQMKLTVARDVADPLFFYYAFHSSAHQDYIRRHAIQTGVPHTNLGILRAMPVRVPPLAEQRAIAQILGALDDKIELNIRMRSILDDVARAVYTHTTAPHDDNTPSHPMAPPLSLFATMLSGGTPSKSADPLWSGSIPWVSPKDMDQWMIDDARDHVAAAAIGNGTRLAPTGSILIVVRSMTLANRLQIGIALRPVAFNQDVKAIVPRSGIASPVLLYALAAQRSLLLASVDEASHGTKRLSSEILARLPITLPVQSMREQATAALTALVDRMAANLRQNRTLAELRDLLLPRLVSGEIRIKDAEEVVQSVV